MQSLRDQLKNQQKIYKIQQKEISNLKNQRIDNMESFTKAMAKHNKEQRDSNNRRRFRREFVRNGKDTIPYLFAIETFFQTCMIETDKYKYMIIFDSWKDDLKRRFIKEYKSLRTKQNTKNEQLRIDNMLKEEEDKVEVRDDIPDDADPTFEELKDWLLDTFPPPQNKEEFREVLLKTRIRWKENPEFVYKNIMIKIDDMNRAIQYINKTLPEKSKLTPIDDELILTVYKNVFIKTNNDKRFHNHSKLNHMIYKHCVNHTKETENMDTWKKAISEFNKIIPASLQYDDRYQYHDYDEPTDIKNIYLSQYAAKTKPGNTNKRPNNNPFEPQRKRRKKYTKTGKYDDCTICGRDNHKPDQCRATVHVNGTPINRDNQQPISLMLNYNNNRDRGNRPKNINCFRCGKPGHIAKNCRSRYPSNRNNTREFGRLQNQYKHQKDRQNNHNKPIPNGFRTYNTQHPENVRQVNEIQQQQKNRDNAQKINRIFSLSKEEVAQLPNNKKQELLAFDKYLRERYDNKRPRQ